MVHVLTLERCSRLVSKPERPAFWPPSRLPALDLPQVVDKHLCAMLCSSMIDLIQCRARFCLQGMHVWSASCVQDMGTMLPVGPVWPGECSNMKWYPAP